MPTGTQRRECVSIPTDPWFNLVLPSIRFPGSGDLGFNYQPNTAWEAPSLFRGDARVEQRVYSEVATPGRQLGRLSDALLSMAEHLGVDTPEVTALREIAQSITAIKEQVREHQEQDARAALDRLAESDPDALRRLLEGYRPPAA
ncbi:MAG: hypothetical protein KDC36_06570 [Thermoleophilia bacterium]|nr:hypothetical protein [Thermoleophilia bacterium]